MAGLEHEYARPFQLGKGKDACLLIHGFTASPAQMRPMGEYLSQYMHVQAPLLPGHGGVIGDMDHVTWRDWLETVRGCVHKMRKAGYRRVFAAGLSMGGVLSLLLAEEKLVDAVVSMAAPVRIYDQLGSAFSGIVWPVYRYRRWKPSPKEGFLHEYDLGYDETPIRRVADLRRLMKMAEKGLGNLTCPLLIVQSRKDETVRPISADILFTKSASRTKQLMMLEQSPHVLTLGPERERVFARAADFLTLETP